MFLEKKLTFCNLQKNPHFLHACALFLNQFPSPLGKRKVAQRQKLINKIWQRDCFPCRFVL